MPTLHAKEIKDIPKRALNPVVLNLGEGCSHHPFRGQMTHRGHLRPLKTYIYITIPNSSKITANEVTKMILWLWGYNMRKVENHRLSRWLAV